ncbi:Holliday junction branch migration protein RuvA [Coriobacteriia bacterium Es71-Z0120]|uniref:Holliday junction branch migration protein RuvA n=1 Tax=Parvivirga hydrogeniphila TaxID=2939460 RepID=UPI002260AD12|nr:Holliday junction branch migration protein RuvA [Parvivirga hydrogeniphila]MCL4079212.1 Holliday junction branch migration protein RuvA [Parvivirga hydrogeniphila]
MIASLTGRLVAKDAAGCVIDVGGVGFRVLMSTSSISALPAEGREASVLTHLHVREDELTLYGFAEPLEREVFLALLGVSGVGPKVALAALSALKPEDLLDAVARHDAAFIARVPGIGTKTAERIVVDLKDRFGSAGARESAAPAAGGVREAEQALLAMGFSAAEVATALKGYDGPPGDAEAALKHALRRLGGGV